MKRVLVVAYHFPPLAGSSGIQRTLRFVQHLPCFGWEATVLTCIPRAYENIKSDLLRDVPPRTSIVRAFALDTARHLAIGGRYPEWLARPDRWVSWWPDAVLKGRAIVRRNDIDAIFTTYPIATAHLIGYSLSRASGLPWIADFRDPMAQEGYPADPRTWTSFKRVEERAFSAAAACTFTTAGAARMYRDRYPASTAQIEIIENGYDEETFAEAQRERSASEPLNGGVPTLVHSGIVYPQERDPTQLFVALASLKGQGIDSTRLRIRFRAAVYDALLSELATRHGVDDMIEIAPHVPYRAALNEMFRADGLLILQAANCNEQVPAKLYEYLRVRKPIIALTAAEGDTAHALKASGITSIAGLDTAEDIAALLKRFASPDRDRMIANDAAIKRASRLHRAEELAKLLDRVCRLSG